MRGLRCGRILAGTALALVLTLPAMAGTTETEAQIEAGVPLPEPANVPPPTAADIGPVTTTATAAPASTPAPAATANTPEKAAPAAEAKTTEAAKASETKTPEAKAPEPAAPATAATAPNATPSSPAATTPSPTATATAKPDAAPQPDLAAIKMLTGKDLVKAPIASALQGVDVAVAEKLRELLATKAERLFPRKNERMAAEAFYRDRGFAPLWSDKGALSARATAAIAYLRGVDADGLFPEDYPAPDFKAGDADAIAEAELKYTNTVFAYVRHAQTGRVAYSRVSADILYKQEPVEPATVLADLTGTRTIGDVLASYEPQFPAYKALKAKLAELRAQPKNAEEEKAPVRIAEGPTLRPGGEDARVPALRKRLNVAGDESNRRYDEKLVEAVKAFQKSAGLTADGLVGNATIRHLNGGESKVRGNVADIIIANLDRWRWLPRELGKSYVMLNIPDYTLKVVDKGTVVWTTKVVTGKPGRMATPMLSETMKYITVNPTWNVPPSIVANEYLPALEQDPDALSRIGLKITQNPDGTVHIFQPPGEGNALGRIRFNFPNKFLVYQHDTPDKYLFDRFPRAYSHGCMRVQYPDKYAEVLLNVSQPNEGWTVERIRKMYGSSEQNINLAHPIPVYITYQTAFVDDAGKLQLRDDVYGRDSETLANLKGEARKNADIPVERANPTNAKPVVARIPGQYQPSDNPFANFFRMQREYNSRPPAPVRGGRYGQQESGGFFGLFR
jgi:murein L,D-transpeptidase YcbB/YkuD